MRLFNRKWIGRVAAGLIPVAAAVVVLAESGPLTVKVRDDCDPATFNAAIGAGTCIGNGDTTFQEFLAEFQKDGKVGDWRFNPDGTTKVKPGTAVTVTNRGGETHTFTRVAEFGGGLVDLLNAGQPTRTECLQAPSANNLVLPPGQMMTGPTLTGTGTVKFQCCIHPWMHLEVAVK
jgi:plastocyanin